MGETDHFTQNVGSEIHIPSQSNQGYKCTKWKNAIKDDGKHLFPCTHFICIHTLYQIGNNFVTLTIMTINAGNTEGWAWRELSPRSSTSQHLYLHVDTPCFLLGTVPLT